MPKVKRTATEEKRAVVRATIRYYTDIRDLTHDAVAKRLDTKPGTLYKKKQRPETFTLGELWDLSRILECPVEELTRGKST